MRDLEMINNVMHSHKNSNLDSSKTASVRHFGNVFEEAGAGKMNLSNHTSNAMSLGGNYQPTNSHPDSQAET
jgi:hypothetical protein